MNTLRRGKLTSAKTLLGTRSLTVKDLESLLEPRTNRTTVARFRDSHHRLARLFASGLRLKEVVERSGYTYNRVSVIYNDPAFQELVANYRTQVTESFKESADSFHELATSNMLKSQRMIADQLDEADEANEHVPLRTLIAISADNADRVGYGKKNTTVNVNVDFAAKLEQRLSRSKVVELRPNPQRPQGMQGRPATPFSASPPLRRRV